MDEVPETAKNRLLSETKLHTDATIAGSLEDNNRLFSEERERLEKWAEDMVYAAEKDLADTKSQIKSVRRQSRLATTLDEQNALQQKLTALEKIQRKQRQQIFQIEDQITEKRDLLIDGLQKRMSQKTSISHLFTIKWRVE
jgi:predicted  nucleic acid-binding Zn-ribbon protein